MAKRVLIKRIQVKGKLIEAPTDRQCSGCNGAILGGTQCAQVNGEYYCKDCIHNE